MMREWLGVYPEVRIYHDDPHLTENLRRWCTNRDIFLVQRNMTGETTVASPFG